MDNIVLVKPNNEELLHGIRNVPEFLTFLQWLCLPKKHREPKSQYQLAEKLGMTEQTLCDWKRRPGFWDAVRDLNMEWAKSKTPEVLEALLSAATSTSPKASNDRRLWLQYVENLKDRSEVDTKNVHFIITRGDARKEGDRPIPGTDSPVASGNPEPVAELPV